MLNLPSLKYCRLRRDIILVYCLLNNDVGIDFNDFFTTPILTSTRGYLYKLYNLMLQPDQEVIFFQSEL